MIEIELKYKINHDKLKKYLLRNNAKFVKHETNHDVYLNHPMKDYKKTDEALRIRKTDDKCEITYKGPLLNNNSKSREELNINIEDINEVIDLFEKLEFIKSGVVRKKREIWHLKDMTICLDNVEGLGEFVEFEKLSEEDVEQTVLYMKSIVKDVGIDPETHIITSYLGLIENQ